MDTAKSMEVAISDLASVPVEDLDSIATEYEAKAATIRAIIQARTPKPPRKPRAKKPEATKPPAK